MGDWEPDSTLQVELTTIYLWVVPAHIAGAWEWRLPIDTNKRQYAVELVQKFQKGNGTATASDGNPAFFAFHLRGDSLSFTLTETLAGERVTSRYAGRARGEEISGSVVIEGGPLAGRHRWRATRGDGR